MPEGAEVKRCSEVLSGIILEKTLVEIKTVSGKLDRLNVKNLENLKLPVKVKSVYSKGKVIFIELDGEYSLISTLGMSGWWYPTLSSIAKGAMTEAYYAKVIDTISKAEKHCRLSMTTEDGSIANYVDPRNFGNFYVVSQDEFQQRVNQIGFDLLSQPYKPDLIGWFSSMVRSKKYSKKKIGEVLLNQSILSGLGNIYRAETLYLAGVNPNRESASLTEDDCHQIIEAADLVLNLAYQGRGTMIYPINEVFHFLSYRSSGFIQRIKNIMPATATAINGHLVYGLSADIMFHKVKQEQIGGRTAWWVPEVQT